MTDKEKLKAAIAYMKKVFPYSFEGDYSMSPSCGHAIHKLFLMLQPDPIRHTFGGVTFEETDEFRPPVVGEWYLAGPPMTAFCARFKGSTDTPFKILKVVK